MMTCRNWQNRAFVLLAAIGVLAVLGSLAFAAANSVQFTYSFARLRQEDKALTGALQVSAELLARDRALAQKVDSSPEAVTILEIPSTGRTSHYVVKAKSAVLAQSPFPTREGDVLVALTAQGPSKLITVREAVYLINSKGVRHAPILITESKPKGVQR